ITALGIEQIVESRAAHRQPGCRRELIVDSPQYRVRAAREVHIDIEGRVWAVICVSVRLPRVSIAAKEVCLVLFDRPAKGRAQLLIRKRQNFNGDKIRGVELFAGEIAAKRAGVDIRSPLGDGIPDHAGGTALAGVKPVLDDLKLADRVLVE